MASERIQRRINQLLDEADAAVLAFDPDNNDANAYLEVYVSVQSATSWYQLLTF
ncbi:MAG: hypothetical protein HQ475_00880 [SAR202 cluster bacterium]|nr:hypothetical protein [SAR202 cluster bacterium]